MTIRWQKEFAGSYSARLNVPNEHTHREWLHLGAWKAEGIGWGWRAELLHDHGDFAHTVEFRGVAMNCTDAKAGAEAQVPYLRAAMDALHRERRQ